jgi:hypothetical protein
MLSSGKPTFPSLPPQAGWQNDRDKTSERTQAHVGMEACRPIGKASEVMRTLLAKDYPPLQKSVARGLREAGFAVDVTGDSEEALWYARGNPSDVIVLDLMLPNLNPPARLTGEDGSCRFFSSEAVPNSSMPHQRVRMTKIFCWRSSSIARSESQLPSS